ncbi:Scr1 family TA system antitoxin-like transcriptional regulator [Nocardiopsis baichengensis]|uniref:Scr1 family TA system antitoxin-like transcriptional regulator n=1 Tax=Nocardiopsis baichengensis TaxID=280240 RepID=UPI000376D9E5|nr:Scr1 family TA system antitoxin-like transcriptional regulator [Nocardiopsis baichengensis]
MAESASSSAQQARQALADRLAARCGWHPSKSSRIMRGCTPPYVSLGVVPMRADRGRMPVEGFWIFDSAQVNVELVSGHLTITQPSEIAMYADTFAELAALALYGERARTLIAAARDSRE